MPPKKKIITEYMLQVVKYAAKKKVETFSTSGAGGVLQKQHQKWIIQWFLVIWSELMIFML